MTESTLLAMAGLATQALFAALLAVLLGRFFRRHRRPYLKEWSRAWWAFCLAQLGALYGLAQQAQLPAAHWSRLLSTSSSLIGAYWHAAWLLFGVYAIASGRSVTRRGGRTILGALALLGIVSALLWAFAPGAAAERLMVRVGVRALVLSVALLAAGVALWRAYRGSAETGPRYVALAFVASGCHQLALFGHASGLLVIPFAAALGYLDVALIGFLGLATVVWLLEEEHHRLTDASRQIERLAYFDMVTGLPNRKLFLDRLKSWIERNGPGGQAAALFFLDVDHFKRVNDTYGHDVGDLMLAAVADRLLHAVREGDTVGRLGGDEFTLLLPAIRTAPEAVDVARHLLERFRAPLRVGEQSLFVGASLGISLFPGDGEDPMTLLRKADTAMYRAKDAGRGRFVVYDDEMSAGARERLALESALRSGELEQQLELHYQPIVRSGSGEIAGAEALVRWRHPERGLLFPAAFLPVAEVSGAAELISDWVLRTACRTASGWRRRFQSDLRISVNLTARAFENPKLAERIAQVLADCGLPADALELEITETMALLSGSDPLSVLACLREAGTRVAVDDFGIGYSSLSYLRELPIETVKLDSSFIRELGRRPEDSRIVGAMIQLAHGLDMEVVAEGVEEEEQMAVLEMLYCDKMQGFLFSRPVPAPEFEALMEAAAPFRTARSPSPGRLAR